MSAIAVLPLLNRMDALIKKMDEFITAIGAVPGVIVEPAPVEVITEAKLNNRYKVLTVSLVAALTDQPIGVKDLRPTTGYATYMPILDIGGGFTYKINSTGAESLPASLGEELEDFEIEEIYLPCGAVGGNAIFYLEYRVEA